jgi:hypothetical protein
VLLGQALGTVVVAEAQVTGAVDDRDEVTLETEIIQGFHAHEPVGVLVEQLGEGGAADVPEEMIEGFGDRERILPGACQEVEVVEDGQFQVAQVVIGRTAAAQTQPE